MKKLSLNQDKCKKMHFGKKNPLCPTSKAHGKPMQSSECEKYLGNLVTSEMNHDKMIEKRANIGIGNVSQIMSLLKDISLGQHYFKISKVLREAMLLNSMLFSSAAWYDLSEQNLKKLEQVDESLLRQILSAHSKTPTSRCIWNWVVFQCGLK